MFLLVFTSAAFVPAVAMPGRLQAFGTHQPVDALVNAERALILGSPAATRTVTSWKSLLLIRGDGMSALDGQAALVTGSTRGIGMAIAAEFARRGNAVAVHGRDQAAADGVAAAISRDGGKAMAATGDVTDFGQVESVRRQIEDAWGPVGILVANAGGSFTPPAPLEQILEEGWRATVDGNLLATFLTLKSFLPGMHAEELPARG